MIDAGELRAQARTNLSKLGDRILIWPLIIYFFAPWRVLQMIMGACVG
jgi:hypothetical protein